MILYDNDKGSMIRVTTKIELLVSNNNCFPSLTAIFIYFIIENEMFFFFFFD